MVRWYVRHAEEYIKAHSNIKLAQHNALTVETYLKNKGRNSALKDWQFSQMVTALQILFVELTKASWAESFPWQHWKDAARELSASHATVARDYDTTVLPDLPPQPIITYEKQQGGVIQFFREKFPKELERLITEIRIRHYSIRTEHAYVQWVARFVRFSQLDNMYNLDAAVIAKYLEHLVIKRSVSSSTQSQALNALVFFYKHVLGHESVELGAFAYSKKPRRLPVVLSHRDHNNQSFGHATARVSMQNYPELRHNTRLKHTTSGGKRLSVVIGF